jgi:ferric-dicitrate binding protein FerR (iron transport regulator)
MQQRYTRPEDLITDEAFLAWFYKTDEPMAAAFEKRLAGDPALKKLAEEAASLLQSMTIPEKPVPAGQLNRAEQRLMSSIKAPAPVVKRSFPTKKALWWSAAAAVLIAATIGLWQYLTPPCSLSYKTQFSEIRSETLADGSEVTLNSNTELQFKNACGKGTDREVWISGEAYFHVKSTPEKTRFIVHSGNFDIIVTGTQFNVVNRTDRNNVLLTSGKVIVRGKDGKEVPLDPGEFLEFAGSGLQKKIVNETPVIAWKERKLIFEKTPMREVAASIREVYGINVTLASDAVASIPISGIFPNDNLDILLRSLEASQDFDIQRAGNTVQIRKR